MSFFNTKLAFMTKGRKRERKIENCINVREREREGKEVGMKVKNYDGKYKCV